VIPSLKETFLLEATEQLQTLEDALLALEREGDDGSTIHTAFRSAHTIKGSAGMAGALDISRFTHAVENVLDLMRDGAVTAEPALITVMLACADHMRDLLSAFEADADPARETAAQGDELGRQLQPWIERAAAATGGSEAAGAAGAAGATGSTWHVSLRPGTEVFLRGVDPLRLIGQLGKRARSLDVSTSGEALPTWDHFDPELCHLGFELALEGELAASDIEEAFAFLRGECDLEILPGGETSLSRVAAADCKSGESGEGHAPRDPAPSFPSAPGDTAPLRPARAKGTRDSIRVDAEKLDQLMDLVGELVIAGAAAGSLAQRRGDTELNESLGIVSRRIEELREAAMQMRMVQIAATFNRFQRVVRDVSHELGKDIELAISGGDTELDKSVVEQIGDPLMHLVRNSIDHGIEPAALRLERGKPARGRVELTARHEAGGIVIEISDDGGGLDTQRILAKAVERGLVAPAAALTEPEIHRLIFEPGFSTADRVTELSGRGVGMDVVRRNIQALRGAITVHSEPGRGCRFSIRLPLTLAIIDGFRVGVGDAHFVVPLESVGECIQFDERAGGCSYMTLHGEMLPYVRLRDLFDVSRSAGHAAAENVVVVHHAGRKVGLVVERLYGGMQAVIKPLGRLFEGIDGLAGSILLGSGEIALFLDIASLLAGADQRERSRAAVH